MAEPLEMTPAEGAGRADGEAALGGKAHLTATGAATVKGDLWLLWDSGPKVGATLTDLWFYGATQVKVLAATGAARAAGEAELIT